MSKGKPFRLKEDGDFYLMSHSEILVHVHSKQHQHIINTEYTKNRVFVEIVKVKTIYHIQYNEKTLCGKPLVNPKTKRRYFISSNRGNVTCEDCLKAIRGYSKRSFPK